MGFSLAGFAAGAAEGITTRIEEERKFSAAALQGRIERASIMKQRQEEEEKALIEELRLRKDQLSQMNVSDPQLQVAYLTSPVAFEALKKARDSRIPVDATELITVNKDKLLYKNPDELIASVTARPKGGEPAKLLQSEGGSLFAPSQTQEQRRFEQFASMRGMTLEDVARAESRDRVKRPEPVATINYKALEKPEKEDADVKLRSLLKEAADAEDMYGKTDERAIAAKVRYNSYQTAVSNLKSMNPEQQQHSQLLQRYMAIIYDPNKDKKYSEEQIKTATAYVNNYQLDKARYEKLGKPNDKMPTETVLKSTMNSRAASEVLLQYGDRIGKGFAEVVIETPDGKYTDLKVTDENPQLRLEVLRARSKAALSHPEVIAEMAANNKTVKDRNIRNALSSFGVDFSEDGKPILPGDEGSRIQIPKKTESPSTSTVSTPGRTPSSAQRTPVPPAAATAAPTPTSGTGRAGQGAPIPSTVAEGTRSKSKSGKDIIYRNGQWEYL
jgi:hypothetical protein